tara:strand:+ start:364 stop:1029 length:666 start_codon:yes stop_codon:yes gene_type:complete
MAKKQKVVEKEFTLDLGNIGKIANEKETPKQETKPEKKEPKPKPTVKKEGSRREAVKEEPKAVVNSKTEDINKRQLRLVVSKDHITQFEDLFKRFVEQTETYWVNTSRVHIFVLGTLYLKQKYTTTKTYHEAPTDFIKFISRKGNRLKSPESTLRKMEATPMFFEMDPEIFQAYFSVIYSFLLSKNDEHNLSYSASYFFKDFIDLLENSFKSFCNFGKNNS